MAYRARSFGVHAAGIAAVVGFAVFLDLLVSFLGTATTDASGFPQWLPQFGGVAETVHLYSTFVWIVTYVVAPVAIFAIGYHYGAVRVTASSDR